VRLAVIPARGGSKGIPRKNLAPLNGRPLIEYTVTTALNCKNLDDVILSTDDDEIASFVSSLGLSDRYRRPKEYATDTAGMFDCVSHCVQWYAAASGLLPDEVLLLQPTSPLRTAADIEAAIETKQRAMTKSVISVHALSEHPYECITHRGNEWRFLAEQTKQSVRRQDYEETFYFINGAIYLTDTRALLESKSFFSLGDTAVYVMPRERGLDIDTPLDLAFAEAILSTQKR
jgi:CMP-N,N'-diacetyllegionaminic acid synthase